MARTYSYTGHAANAVKEEPPTIAQRQMKKRTDAAATEASYRQQVDAYTQQQKSRPPGNYPRDAFPNKQAYEKWLENF